MNKNLFLFFSFCSIYLILLFLGDFEVNFSSFFLGNALQNKTLIFMLIGIGIFWSGKEVIDNSIEEKKSFFLSSWFGVFIVTVCWLLLNHFFYISNLLLSLENILGFSLIKAPSLLSGVVILPGLALSFILYKNRENINFEVQRTIEHDFEEKKEEEFIKIFPKINKIPLINLIYKWGYKQGKQDIIILIGILIFGFILRIWNLGNLGLMSDEFTINNAIEGFLQTGIPSLRSGLLYFDTPLHIVFTGFLFEVFGNNEFTQRLPSAIFGTGLGIFVYLISKEIGFGKKIGLILTFLILIHPWFLEYSRFGKGYIMGAFFYLGAIYFFLKSLQVKKYIYVGVIFTLFGILAHKINYVLIFAPIVIFFLSLDKKKNFHNYIIHCLISLIIIFIGYYLFGKLNSYGFWANGTFLSNFLNPINQTSVDISIWGKIKKLIPFNFLKPFDLQLIYYYSYSLPILNIFILIGGCAFLLNIKKIKLSGNKQVFFIIGILLFFCFTYLYSIQLFDKVNKGYIFFAMTLIIIFLGYALYILKQYHKKIIYYITSIVSIILLFQSLQIITSDYGSKIYGPYSFFEGFIFRQDNKTPCEYLKKIYKSGDIVITLGSPGYCKYYGNIDSNYYVLSSEYTKGVIREDGNFYDLYEKSQLILNYDDFISKIKYHSELGKKIYIYSSYSMLSGNNDLAPRIWHIWGGYKEFMNSYEQKKIYTGKDGVTSIYLFQ